MNINDIFRQTGEQTYYTPIDIIGDLIDEQTAIANPPFENDKRSIQH